MNQYIYKKSVYSDKEQIKKLFLCIADSVENKSVFNWSSKSVDQEISQSEFFICEKINDKKIISFIAYREGFEVVEIIALGTDAAYSNQGVMFGLLASFANFISRVDNSIQLEVHFQNYKAISLYEKCGFKILRIRKSYYKDGGDCLVMMYKLELCS